MDECLEKQSSKLLLQLRNKACNVLKMMMSDEANDQEPCSFEFFLSKMQNESNGENERK
jgi:hypothetical protein